MAFCLYAGVYFRNCDSWLWTNDRGCFLKGTCKGFSRAADWPVPSVVGTQWSRGKPEKCEYGFWMWSASSPDLFLLIPALSQSPGQESPPTTSGPHPASPSPSPFPGLCCFFQTFFWVSAAGDLLVSVGQVCRSRPVLEIFPGLHPRLQLLRQSLHAPAVRLAGLGRADAISGACKFSSACSTVFHPCCYVSSRTQTQFLGLW